MKGPKYLDVPFVEKQPGGWRQTPASRQTPTWSSAPRSSHSDGPRRGQGCLDLGPDLATSPVSPALSVSARSGELSRDGDTLAAPQASHDGGGGQGCAPGGVTFGLVNEGGGGAAHDAPLSCGRYLEQREYDGFTVWTQTLSEHPAGLNSS